MLFDIISYYYSFTKCSGDLSYINHMNLWGFSVDNQFRSNHNMIYICHVWLLPDPEVVTLFIVCQEGASILLCNKLIAPHDSLTTVLYRVVTMQILTYHWQPTVQCKVMSYNFFQYHTKFIHIVLLYLLTFQYFYKSKVIFHEMNVMFPERAVHNYTMLISNLFCALIVLLNLWNTKLDM